MRFTEAERAEIGAELRKQRAEGKNDIHILPSMGRWSVFRAGATGKARKRFHSKDDAIVYGREIAKRLRSRLVIHTKDAGVEREESFSEAVRALASSAL